jgi:hypothetical protein
MKRRLTLITAVLVAAASWTEHPLAQAPSGPELDALRRQVERRFDPLPLRDGVNLRPRVPVRGVRSIEITGGVIAVDGSPVTGAELRERIGDDAELVIQLSYLDADARRTMFGGSPEPPLEVPAAPSPGTPPAPASPQAEPDNRPSDRRDRDWRGDGQVKVGSDVRVGPDEVIDGDVVAIGGSATIEGRVNGDVVAVGGSVELGPRAVVEQDVAVIGGRLRRADGSRVGGNIKEVGFGALTDWNGPRDWVDGWWLRRMGSTFAMASTVTRGAVLCLLAALVVLLAGGHLDAIGHRVSTEPLKAGAIGFLAQLLFLPLLIVTIVVLVVTLVGIPLLALIPFAILGLAVVGLVGFTAVARQIGEHVSRRLAWTSPSTYVTTFTGVAVILMPVLLARLALMAGGTGVSPLWHGLALIGWCVEYVAWTVGFGAVALVRFGKKLSADGAQFTAGSASLSTES